METAKLNGQALTGSYSDAEDEEVERDRALVRRWKEREQMAREARRKYDWEWVVRYLFVRGYQFARYERGTNTVVFTSRTGVKIPINLTQSFLRGVRNQITSFQPKWEVTPKVTTDRAFENARYSGKVLDSLYDTKQVKRKIKEVVNDALITSVGIWHFDIDEKTKDVLIRRIDPFDFYVDPNVKSPDLNDTDEGAEYVCLATQVTTEMIRKNKEFAHRERLQAESMTAASEYKRFLQQVIRYQMSGKQEVNETSILHHIWERVWQDDGTFKIRAGIYTDHIDRPLFNEILDDETEYPFEILQGDIEGGELYGEAWVKHIIPINRVINALEAYVFEYNHLFAKGKWIMDKNSGTRIILNQNGQIIEKNRGSTIQPITMPPLPSTPMEQLSRMKMYAEDISGIHEVSFGRLPTGARSGTAIAELKQADATNQADLVDNLEDFLARSGRKVLKMVAENWNTTKLISVTNTVGKPEHFMAIGERAGSKKKTFKFGDQELPLAVIGADNEVKVQIGSWLAYTKEARQERLKEYFRLGIIDQQTFLQHAEFADIDGILKRTREEQVFQSKSGARSQSIQKKFGIEMTDQELAMAENSLMVLDGIEQHAEPGDDHNVHLLIHKEEGEHPLVKAHIAEHLDYQKWERRMASQPVVPEGMPMGVPGMMPGIPGEMPPPPPTTPPEFTMLPPRGPGAPPFQSNLDIITGGGG